MNMQCIDCHTEFPVLNQFGRQFKLTGYTLSADPSVSNLPPIAVMLQPSFTNTQASQAGGAAPGRSASGTTGPLDVMVHTATDPAARCGSTHSRYQG